MVNEPILTLQSQHPPQSARTMDSTRPVFTSPFTNGFNSYPQPPSCSNRTPTSSTPVSAAGRKRSRDEAALNLEDDYFPVLQPVIPALVEDEDEWEYGEGMTLIKPNRSGYIIEAGSQTGTWAEEKAAETEQVKIVPSPERPPLRAAKSQRLNLASTPAIAEEFMSNGALTTPTASSPTNGYTEPTVDDFTRHLGIGWSLISADEDIQAAARGWTKYINNHFPVTDAKIRLQSRGLASYLVEANEGYFLFGEDLKQGRMVSTNLDKTWENLRGPQPVFDSDLVMEAGETPKVNGNETVNHNIEMIMGESEASALNGITNGHNLEVEMDMS